MLEEVRLGVDEDTGNECLILEFSDGILSFDLPIGEETDVAIDTLINILMLAKSVTSMDEAEPEVPEDVTKH